MTIKRTTGGKLLRSAAGHLCLSCCDGTSCDACIGKCYWLVWSNPSFPGCDCEATIIEYMEDSGAPFLLAGTDFNQVDPCVAYAFEDFGVGALCFAYDASYTITIVPENGCPQLGTNSYVMTWSDIPGGGTTECIGSIDITIEEIACCADIDAATYYLSCDIVYTRHEDAGGGISDCLGTGGTETCNTTASMADEPMTSAVACLFASDNTFNCYFPTSVVPPDPNYVDGFTVGQTGGVWVLNFGTGGVAPEQSTTGPAGTTPVGTYPDITYCYFDGYNAYNLSITNIVITA